MLVKNLTDALWFGVGRRGIRLLVPGPIKHDNSLVLVRGVIFVEFSAKGICRCPEITIDIQFPVNDYVDGKEDK